MTKSIHHQYTFPHPPEVVWEYLTNAELMEQWLMKSDFQPVMGHEFQFRINPMPSLNFDGIVYCRVLEIVPFRRLSYSWRTGPGNGDILIDSVVEWKLVPTDKGTELFLDHSGFSAIEELNMFSALNDGWLKNIHKIADRINAVTNGATNT
jgi:uncharacterized protein YndB with AHSA1/START domain